MPDPSDADLSDADLSDAVAALVAARHGHFRLESGHHGDLWLDLDALFWSLAAVAPLTDRLAERLATDAVDVVCGPLVGGALLGQLVAARMDVAFVHAERTTTRSGSLRRARCARWVTR